MEEDRIIKKAIASNMLAIGFFGLLGDIMFPNRKLRKPNIVLATMFGLLGWITLVKEQKREAFNLSLEIRKEANKEVES